MSLVFSTAAKVDAGTRLSEPGRAVNRARWPDAESGVSAPAAARYLFVPLMCLMAGLACVIGGLLYLAADGQNRISRESAEQVAHGALGTFAENLEKSVRDYSWWGDTVRHTVEGLDLQWSDDNLAAGSSKTLDIDDVVVLDVRGAPIYGAIGGRRASPAAALKLLGPGLDILTASALDRKGRPGEPPMAASAFLSTGGPPYLAAAVVIKREAAEAPDPKGFLVFATALDGKFLGAMARRFLLDNLHFTTAEPGPAEAAIDLTGVDGRRIGHLAWTADRPGTRLLRGLAIPVAVIFAAAAAFLGVIAHRTRRAAVALERSHDTVSEQAEALKTAERELQQKVDQLDRYFSMSLDLLCIANTEGRFIKLNAEWEKCLGYSIPELEGRAFLDLVHPDDRPSTVATVGRLRLQEDVTGFENRYRHKDGSYRWIEWRSKPFGETIYAAARDITDRKRMEIALARSEERLRLAMEAANDGLWELNFATHGGEWSPRCYAMLGYAPGEFPVSFEACRAMVHPDDREAAASTMLESIRRGQAFVVELRMACKEGGWRWILARGKPVEWDAAGRPVRVIGTHTDIDAMKRTEAALSEARIEAEQANRAKSEFLANMSHELRTPLNSILGFTELMMTEIYGPLGSPRYAEYAKDVHDSGGLLLDIINDVLDLSRVEVGAVRLDEKPVDVPRLFGSLERLLRQRAVEHGLQLVTQVGPGTPRLMGDPLRLKQILLNLASNAIKFTKPGGRVAMSSAVGESGAVILTVADTGIGMTADEIAIAVRPFGLVATAQQRGHQGTGLGLPIAKSLAELHGAVVEIRSTPNVGTAIDVRFPPQRSISTPA